jgi:hypothetical protein
MILIPFPSVALSSVKERTSEEERRRQCKGVEKSKRAEETHVKEIDRKTREEK